MNKRVVGYKNAGGIAALAKAGDAERKRLSTDDVQRRDAHRAANRISPRLDVSAPAPFQNISALKMTGLTVPESRKTFI